ncbi:squalene/phytoene synthase family protein [uncultured Tateyamaria sp.]|uniref:squalene/phytoene synthase family protein n=1 Tax=uncultured Tateyamaria sp. TaxID=455651 RepID=UPI0026065D7C|nr:squalene/phytoene synthase family protein [uncultured Tateyamaria sp.]
MTLPDAVVPCAQLVDKGDPDRFRTVMAAPMSARLRLFPLYAFNIEVARAPWVTQEAMIAEMRLQWWRDALEEVADGRSVRKHEVTTPLAGVLSPAMARCLDEAVAARRWDIYKDPFEDEAHLLGYLNQTSGHLMWTAAQVLGAPQGQEAAVRSVAVAGGLASFLRAVPQLEASKRIPLVDGTHDGIIDLARRVKDAVVRPSLPASAKPALWPAIGAVRLLNDVTRDPGSVADGRLAPPVTPWRLGLSVLSGRVVL